MISLEETKLSQVPEEAQSQMPTMHGQSLSCLSFTVLATRSSHTKVDMMEGGHEPADDRTEGVSSRVLRRQSGGSGCKSGSGARNSPGPFFVAPLLSFAFICNFEERGCSNRHRCREKQGEAHPVPPLIVHSPQLSKLLRLLRPARQGCAATSASA